MEEAERRRPSNVETLRAAGVIAEGLPEEYHEVFERLSEQELAAITLMKARLDAMKGRLPDDQDYASFLPI
ncbi:MAG TPA: aroma-sacti cluster domain-containing protein [Gaiellaceae bacterium]|nr:aroma-sacti cluster domain-containing protein [Gaiellaceae bacterium]